jgi:hypothetical protein
MVEPGNAPNTDPEQTESDLGKKEKKPTKVIGAVERWASLFRDIGLILGVPTLMYK